MRERPEWIAKHDDEKIPDLVKLRIWSRDEGKCHISGLKIRPGDAYDFDHIVALCNGGQHRESNIALVLRDRHKEKTRADLALKAKGDRIRKRHLGIRKPSRFPGSRNSKFKKKISGEVVLR